MLPRPRSIPLRRRHRNLASLVKGLAGVGIGNRVIAVFDNDTAGAIQADEVRKLKLPENFRILTLSS
jgi:hypothetical protein